MDWRSVRSGWKKTKVHGYFMILKRNVAGFGNGKSDKEKGRVELMVEYRCGQLWPTSGIHGWIWSICG
jgi:hypothetical protein